MRQLSSPWSHLPERVAAPEPVRHEDIHPPPQPWIIVYRRLRELQGSSLVVIGLCLLLVLAVLSSCLRTDNHAAASRPVASTATATPATAAPAAGSQANRGMTFGQVTATDGTIMTVQAMLGGTVVVHSTPATEVLALGGGRISDIAVGYAVFVQGDRNPDGSIVASLIIGAPLSLSGK
ncbi:DUF5666 domain-containing protein [Nocardia vaccinii]|uniref:DUF5666 domain-containing protein n=1 Tax=Nocardia vaccinii TaxID=1822 RepID=UPI000829A634|nr:DUF5666 domain-containing protein [Nocardia vaccinii]